MQYFRPIFTEFMRLSVGTNSEYFCEYPDYFHIRSVLDDGWYNLIVPKLENPLGLKPNELSELISKENSQGKKISFYINKNFLNSYQKYLEKENYQLIGNDTYLLKTISQAENTTGPEGYLINTQYDLNKLIGVLEKCFPDWPNEKVYSQNYEKYKLNSPDSRLFETFAIHNSDQIIGGGSVSLDKNLNLGYLHNSGVLETHWRKGLHTSLVSERCNFCLKNDVTRVLSIVEDTAGSYTSLLKKDFVEIDQFFVFSKT